MTFDDLINALDDPVNAESAETTAKVYINRYDHYERQNILAPKLLEHALALVPDMPEALVRVGLLALYRDGDKDKAQVYINRCIKLHPDYDAAYQLLDKVENDEIKIPNYDIREDID